MEPKAIIVLELTPAQEREIFDKVDEAGLEHTNAGLVEWMLLAETPGVHTEPPGVLERTLEDVLNDPQKLATIVENVRNVSKLFRR